MNFYKEIFLIIPKDWRRWFYALNLFFLVFGIFEMIGVASIMPFVGMLSNPQGFSASMPGQEFLAKVGLQPEKLSVHLVGIIVLILFVLTNILSIFSVWCSIRFSNKLAVRLATDVAKRYFANGYEFLRSSTPSVLANYTVREIERVVSGGILQLCVLVSRTFQALLIFLLLLMVSPLFSIAFAGVSIILYAIFYLLLKRRLELAGEILVRSSNNATHSANEFYTGAKEVIANGNFEYFLTNIQKSLSQRGMADESVRVWPMMPKYTIELSAFTALLSMPIYRAWTGGNYQELVPFMALFAYAGYRLLPALQQIFTALSTLKFAKPIVKYFFDILGQSIDRSNFIKAKRLSNHIVIEQVQYIYPGADVSALQVDLLQINSGETIAVVGLSGSGKTTLVDVVLGLCKPRSNKLIVDGFDFSKVGLTWEEGAIGYAPQFPIILNATIAENIAFGIHPEHIDRERCQIVARIACIDEVIENLPDGYNTILGEAGIELSGGEKQRIAVARALYVNPGLLILDEPTSALDPIRSRQLFYNLRECSTTMLVITHDWDALEFFDRILILEGGKLVAQGPASTVANHLCEMRKAEKGIF